VGQNWNEGTVRALAWANRERGKDSLGFFDSTGKMMKVACDPKDALCKGNVSNWIHNSKGWFIAGHTRQATHGKVNRENAHPFRYGKTIGSHNGMITSPQKYAVDSMYLFDALNKAKGDYEVAWCDIEGYWGVSWFDGTSFFLQIHNGDLSIAKCGNVYYYSSNQHHLEACVGSYEKIITLTEGQTLKFDCVDGVLTVTEAPTLVNNESMYMPMGMSYTRSYAGSSYKQAKRERYNRDTKEFERDRDSYVRDYDSDWKSAWEAYTNSAD
jgi:hypothetical protein